MNAAASVLRPLSLGEILDRAIRLYRNNFLKFIGIIAIVQIPLSLLTLGAGLLTVSSSAEILNPDFDPGGSFADIFGPGYFLGIGSSLVLSVISLLLVQGVATAALTRLIADTYLGETYGMLDAYRRIGNSWWSIIKALLVYLGLAILLFVWFLIPCAGWISGLGMILTLSFMVLPLVAPVVVIEGQGGRRSLRRAWELVRKRFWWVFGFMFLLFVLGQIVVGLPNLVVNFIIGFILPEALSSGSNVGATLSIQTILQSLSALFFTLLYLPLQLSSSTLVYFDLRVRNEGLDLMVQAEEQTEGGLTVADLVAQPASIPTTSVVTWQEMGYFSVFTLGLALIYGVLIGGLALLFALIGASGGF